MAEAPAAALDYLQGCPEGFAAQADVLFVVEGQGLPVHSHFLGRYSGYFAGMLSDLDEQPATPTKGRSSAAAFSRHAPLRLAKPFAGVRLEHARLFLASLYRPAEVAAFAATLSDQPSFAGVYDLAHRFDCGLLQGALQARLASSSSAVEEMLKSDMLGWIEFADRFGLPELRGRCVALLLRLLADPATGERLLKVLDWGRADESLSQQLFGGLLSAVHQLQSPKRACYSCGYSQPGSPSHCPSCGTYIQHPSYGSSKLSAKDVTTALPSAPKLAAWSKMGDPLQP